MDVKLYGSDRSIQGNEKRALIKVAHQSSKGQGMTEGSGRPRPTPYDQGQVRERLKIVAGRFIPPGTTIARQALEEMIAGHENDREWIRSNFSELVELVQVAAYQVYLEYEAHAGGRAVEEVFAQLAGPQASAKEALGLVAHYFKGIDLFTLGLAQGRKSRAGFAFDLVVRDLLTRLGYPFSGQVQQAGRTDLLLPSAEYYAVNPLGTYVLTLKRTLRERWKQVLTEGRDALGVFLATIDEGVPADALKEMMRHKIRVVVPRRLKQQIPAYTAAPNVITFEQFLEQELDPAMVRWKKEGVLPESSKTQVD